MRKFIICKHKAENMQRKGTKAGQSYKRPGEKQINLQCSFLPYAVLLGFYQVHMLLFKKCELYNHLHNALCHCRLHIKLIYAPLQIFSLTWCKTKGSTRPRSEGNSEPVDLTYSVHAKMNQYVLKTGILMGQETANSHVRMRQHNHDRCSG